MKFLLLTLAVTVLQSSPAQTNYPDAGLPADTPRVFSPGVISNDLSNRDFTISPSGEEIFYTVQAPRFSSSTILLLVRKNHRWGSPQVAPFSGRYRDLEAAFSPDGNTIYFVSDRPLDGMGEKKDFDIWIVHRLPDGSWGRPENAGPVVNSARDEFYPSVAKNGNLYFTVEMAEGKGKEDIVFCTYAAGRYAAPVRLPETINSSLEEFNAFADPDEQFILFSSFGRADDFGGGDLYISRKDSSRHWKAAEHLPRPVNSPGLDYCPFVSWDKKCLFFSSNRVNPALQRDRKKTYGMLNALLQHPGNGLDDLYWVKF